ncbi:MAG: translation elongation factor Ts, partial [Deltaproteobacteria bacterium]|nr:translation elongation factor Ts [Deltaproteobacteria bacterium]
NALLVLKYPTGETVKEALNLLIGKIGENIQIRRFEYWKANGANEVVGFYLHAGSKIGVLIEIDDAAKKVTSELAKEVAMHAAAMQPRYVRPSEVSASAVEKEKEILMASVDTKKPKEIQEKIVQGKLNKFYSEVCLEDQIFVKDLEGKTTVKQWLQQLSPSAKISRFVRLQVGAE